MSRPQLPDLNHRSPGPSASVQRGPQHAGLPALAAEKRGEAMGLKILGVSGSLRSDSITRRALERGLEFADALGAHTRLLDLGHVELPMYRPDASPTANVRTIADAVAWADAFLLATPDYHGSMSGAMKNFLDYHWDEFAGKLFGYICASHEKGLTAMDQMRTAVRQCYGWSLPYGVSSTAITTSTIRGHHQPPARRPAPDAGPRPDRLRCH